MAALAGAVRAVRLGEQDNAVVVGSELVSRSLRRSRYGGTRAGFDAEFLRWTLSDGAGAVVVEPVPRPDGASLRVDWIHLVSHANRYPVCMSAGGTGSRSWLDLPDATAAERDGMLRLRQDVKLLPSLFRVGLQEFVKLVRLGRIRPSDVDHVLCHYSAEHFRGEIFDLLRGADLMIDERRWYTNLHTRGNTGAASIFVMLEEAWRTGRFQPGDRILLIVPESGRFSFAFAQLTCVAPADTTPHREHATPSPLGEADDGIDGDVVRWTVLELSRVWADFERRVRAAPVVRRIDAGTATLDDYRALLMHLRQQVVEGGRWISRAASSFSVELFELRSAAIRHAAEEHRDFRLLEEDFRASAVTSRRSGRAARTSARKPCPRSCSTRRASPIRWTCWARCSSSRASARRWPGSGRTSCASSSACARTRCAFCGTTGLPTTTTSPFWQGCCAPSSSTANAPSASSVPPKSSPGSTPGNWRR